MRIAGALTLIVGILLGVVLCLWPTHLHEFGTDISCGIPARGVLGYQHDDSGVITLDDSSGETAEEHNCRRNSIIRVAIGGFIGVGGFALGLPLMLAGPSAEERERARFEKWQRWQWEQQNGPPRHP